MDIDLRLIGIIASCIICLVSNIMAYKTFLRLEQCMMPPPSRWHKLRKIMIFGILAILSIIALFVLNFKFWWINLIFSIPVIILTIVIIYNEILC